MSLSVGRGLLLDAQKRFVQDWARLRESWTDQNAEAFEHRYIDPVDAHVRRASEAMERLAEIAAAARRACE
ncbi:MAG: hypothetical protein IPJ41_11245 [Phycisphaerales bacterium]|nr:hypothetical protein [Phycisphaerales bacterium]